MLVTLPWGERLGGAEAMLQTVLDGVQGTGHTIELVFFQDGPWPRELREAGFAVEVIPAGRMRDPLGWPRTVARLARPGRSRPPHASLNRAGQTQNYRGRPGRAA